MTVDDIYADFRIQFAGIVEAVDAKHLQLWDSAEHEIKAVWFESLAHVINDTMSEKAAHATFSDMFAYFERHWRQGDDKVKNCIDACFVENLFWQVPARNAKAVWPLMPDNLRRLYIGFHGRPPKGS